MLGHEIQLRKMKNKYKNPLENPEWKISLHTA
jgi:hypothetical protein